MATKKMIFAFSLFVSSATKSFFWKFSKNVCLFIIFIIISLNFFLEPQQKKFYFVMRCGKLNFAYYFNVAYSLRITRKVEEEIEFVSKCQNIRWEEGGRGEKKKRRNRITCSCSVMNAVWTFNCTKWRKVCFTNAWERNN